VFTTANKHLPLLPLQTFLQGLYCHCKPHSQAYRGEVHSVRSLFWSSDLITTKDFKHVSEMASALLALQTFKRQLSFVSLCRGGPLPRVLGRPHFCCRLVPNPPPRVRGATRSLGGLVHDLPVHCKAEPTGPHHPGGAMAQCSSCGDRHASDAAL
jgi:hypothetical protein